MHKRTSSAAMTGRIVRRLEQNAAPTMQQRVASGNFHGEITTPEATRPPMLDVCLASHDLRLGGPVEWTNFGGLEIEEANRLDHIGLGPVLANYEDHQRAN